MQSVIKSAKRDKTKPRHSRKQITAETPSTSLNTSGEDAKASASDEGMKDVEMQDEEIKDSQEPHKQFSIAAEAV